MLNDVMQVRIARMYLWIGFDEYQVWPLRFFSYDAIMMGKYLIQSMWKSPRGLKLCGSQLTHLLQKLSLNNA